MRGGEIQVFQSTPPRGWRQAIPAYLQDSATFQSTPPRGWRRSGGGLSRRRGNFNPLHREGGDLTAIATHVLNGISIHSTARVETGRLASQFSNGRFQSTPPRGWRQKYYTITTTILHHISTNKSYPTPLKSRPTIPAHSQIRSHCANFPVRIPP